jgi:predicted Zn-dependent peptidase
MFEHMIGKGTATVGTTNPAEEKTALANVEAAYARLEEERRKEFRADPQKIKKLQAELDAEVERANRFVVPNEFVQVIEENGAVGFNAGTALDATQYFYSLPSNRAELWFLLQSQWFRQPIFREFYKERDVVREERRMRTESNPVGQLQEMMLATAFTAQPYRTGRSGKAISRKILCRSALRPPASAGPDHGAETERRKARNGGESVAAVPLPRLAPSRSVR